MSVAVQSKRGGALCKSYRSASLGPSNAWSGRRGNASYISLRPFRSPPRSLPDISRMVPLLPCTVRTVDVWPWWPLPDKRVLCTYQTSFALQLDERVVSSSYDGRHRGGGRISVLGARRVPMISYHTLHGLLRAKDVGAKAEQLLLQLGSSGLN